MDWSDKVDAYNIDETCAGYTNQSTEVQFHPHSTKFEERWASASLPPAQTPCPIPLSSLPPSSRLAPGGPPSGPLHPRLTLRPSP